jgi:diguanylate cyclase (GGDEF)-like protein
MSTPPDSSSTSHSSALAGARARRDWYALEERHAALLTGRVVAIGAIAIAAAVAPLDMTGRERALAVAACLAALVLHLLLRWVSERWPRRLLAAVDAGLVVDALLVLALALLSGGTDSLALWLLPLFALAVTLALSVRTGVKAALLSALVLAGLQAAETDVPVYETAGPLAMVVAVVVVAGTLATVNERELRRRGERMAALHDASAELVGVDDPERLSHIATAAAGRLLPGWDVEMHQEGAPEAERAWREDGRVHLEIPVTVRGRREEGDVEEPLGTLAASRAAPRIGRARVRRQQLLALQTLATALGVALQRVEMMRRLEHLSMIDPLTGLGNRRAFDDALEVEFARVRRGGGSVGLILIDVDHFKSFNDRHGHQAGDEALAEVARVLSGTARAEDHACRIGGEEFALLLSGAQEGAAAAVAERVRHGVAGRQMPYGSVTVSLGVASCDRDGEPAQLVAAADERLYAAKAQGRNRVVAASPVADASP